jgi:hypothetical protein
MRSGRSLLAALACALLALVSEAACPLAHQDLQPYQCYKDTDCFAGETCYPAERKFGETGECRVILPDSAPREQRIYAEPRHEARGETRPTDATSEPSILEAGPKTDAPVDAAHLQ